MKFKKCPIPRGVQYWVFFHNHILEKPAIREGFLHGAFNSCEDFEAYLRIVLPIKVHGPRHIRGNAEYTRELIHCCYCYYTWLLHPSSLYEVREKGDFGLGLFVKAATSVKCGERLLPNQLFGFLFDVGEEEVAVLREKGYPSLYGTCIMTGPLALMNHQCKASLFFTQPSKPLAHVKEFEKINCVRAKAKLQSCRFNAGDELVVDYFGKDKPSGFICKCIYCNK
jgi:hypothetical protein